MPDKAPGTPERYDDDARLSDGTASTDEAAEPGGADGAVSAGNGAGSNSGDPDSGAHAPEKPRKNPALVWAKEIVTVVAIALVLSFLLKTFLFRAFYIPSESMEKTLDVYDRIFINLLVPGPFDLSRGDVVVFKDTQAWLPPVAQKPAGPMDWVGDTLEFVGLAPDASEQHLVKRVIGLPGDHVSCCDAEGRISVNGVALDETYINPAEAPTPEAFDVVVPEGKVWVMGDNRQNSQDSRYHLGDPGGGSVPVDNVVGVAFVTVWPADRFTLLRNPGATFESVPEP